MKYKQAKGLNVELDSTLFVVHYDHLYNFWIL